MTIQAFRDELSEDSHFQRYRSIRQTAARILPYEKICGELDQLMAARQVRAYATSNIQPRELLNVSMDEVNHRARASEILLVAKRRRADLASVIDAVWSQVVAEYGEHLKDMRTKAERDNAVSSCFSKGYELLSNIDSIIEQCEVIIKDIDQSSFHLTRVANLYEMLIRTDKLANVEI